MSLLSNQSGACHKKCQRGMSLLVGKPKKYEREILEENLSIMDSLSGWRIRRCMAIILFRRYIYIYYTLRIIGPSYKGVWLCIAGFWDLQSTSFESSWLFMVLRAYYIYHIIIYIYILSSHGTHTWGCIVRALSQQLRFIFLNTRYIYIFYIHKQ